MIKTLESRGSSLGSEEQAAVNYYSRHMEMFKRLNGAWDKCIRRATPTVQPCGGLGGPSLQDQSHHMDPGKGHHKLKGKIHLLPNTLYLQDIQIRFYAPML